MVILGLVLIVLGVLVVVAGVLTAQVTGSHLELLGIHVGAVTLFVLGVVAGVAVLVGFSLTRWGAKRGLQHRRDQKQLAQLSDKLDRNDHDRRRHDDPDVDVRG